MSDTTTTGHGNRVGQGRAHLRGVAAARLRRRRRAPERFGEGATWDQSQRRGGSDHGADVLDNRSALFGRHRPAQSGGFRRDVEMPLVVVHVREETGGSARSPGRRFVDVAHDTRCVALAVGDLRDAEWTLSGPW
jgi:hypothetical protein